MNVLNAIEMRKSIRDYASERVKEEEMEAIIRAGSLAPVFGRFHITVVQNPALLNRLDSAALEMMKNSGNAFLEKRAAQEGYSPLYGAPALIILSASGGNDAQGFNMANVSCAAENMIIQATELGLGTCFVMGPLIAFANPALLDEFQIPKGCVPLVGRQAETAGADISETDGKGAGEKGAGEKGAGEKAAGGKNPRKMPEDITYLN